MPNWVSVAETVEGVPWAWVAGALSVVGGTVIVAVRWLVGQHQGLVKALSDERSKSEGRFAEVVKILNQSVENERNRTERLTEVLVTATQTMRGITEQVTVMVAILEDLKHRG